MGLGLCLLLFYASWKAMNTLVFSVPECDLSLGPCVSKLASGEAIELRIKPTRMPVLTSLKIAVKTENISANKIIVTFKGSEMNMGEFQYSLVPQKNGVYTTQTILPSCIHEQMAWHTTVKIEGYRKHYIASFVFINQRPESV